MLEVDIETFGVGPVEVDALHALVSHLARLGAAGAATSVGGIAGGVGASFAIEVPARGEPFSANLRRAIQLFERACADAGIAHDGIARVVVMTPEMAERELSEPPETYLGAAEVAESLGISRQRLAELRMRSDFPAPVAELAAGPVWRASTLQRFVASWDRRPGRRPASRSEPA